MAHNLPRDPRASAQGQGADYGMDWFKNGGFFVSIMSTKTKVLMN
jgi:hypothetical protein